MSGSTLKTQATIPLSAPIIGPDGQLNAAWYGFFRTLLVRTGNSSGTSSDALLALIEASAAQIAALTISVDSAYVEMAYDGLDAVEPSPDQAALLSELIVPLETVQSPDQSALLTTLIIPIEDNPTPADDIAQLSLMLSNDEASLPVDPLAPLILLPEQDAIDIDQATLRAMMLAEI